MQMLASDKPATRTRLNQSTLTALTALEASFDTLEASSEKPETSLLKPP